MAFATAPLHKAAFEPDLIHIICNVLQAYHIANDYSSATDEHPVESAMLMNSAVCGGATWTYVNQKINLVPMCNSSYTSGKTEQGEINVYIPWKKFRPTVKRLLERTSQYGGLPSPEPAKLSPASTSVSSAIFWRLSNQRSKPGKTAGKSTIKSNASGIGGLVELLAVSPAAACPGRLPSKPGSVGRGGPREAPPSCLPAGLLRRRRPAPARRQPPPFLPIPLRWAPG